MTTMRWRNFGVTTSPPVRWTLAQYRRLRLCAGAWTPHAASWFELAGQFTLPAVGQIRNTGPVDFGTLPCGHMPVYWDTFVMNNSVPNQHGLAPTPTAAQSTPTLENYLAACSDAKWHVQKLTPHGQIVYGEGTGI